MTSSHNEANPRPLGQRRQGKRARLLLRVRRIPARSLTSNPSTAPPPTTPRAA
jgi:hypothetical protein